jgi:hypothetical protein
MTFVDLVLSTHLVLGNIVAVPCVVDEQTNWEDVFFWAFFQVSSVRISPNTTVYLELIQSDTPKFYDNKSVATSHPGLFVLNYEGVRWFRETYITHVATGVRMAEMFAEIKLPRASIQSEALQHSSSSSSSMAAPMIWEGSSSTGLVVNKEETKNIAILMRACNMVKSEVEALVGYGKVVSDTTRNTVLARLDRGPTHDNKGDWFPAFLPDNLMSLILFLFPALVPHVEKKKFTGFHIRAMLAFASDGQLGQFESFPQLVDAINRTGYCLVKAFNESPGIDGRSIFLTPLGAFMANLNSCSGYPASSLYLPYVVHHVQGRLVKYAALFPSPACAAMTRASFIEQALEVFAPVDFGTLRNDSNEFKERYESEMRARQVAERKEELVKKDNKRKAGEPHETVVGASKKKKRNTGGGGLGGSGPGLSSVAGSSSAPQAQSNPGGMMCLAATGIALGVRNAAACAFGTNCQFIHITSIPNPCPAAQKAAWAQALSRSRDSKFKTVVLKAIQDLP